MLPRALPVLHSLPALLPSNLACPLFITLAPPPPRLFQSAPPSSPLQPPVPASPTLGSIPACPPTHHQLRLSPSLPLSSLFALVAARPAFPASLLRLCRSPPSLPALSHPTPLPSHPFPASRHPRISPSRPRPPRLCPLAPRPDCFADHRPLTPTHLPRHKPLTDPRARRPPGRRFVRAALPGRPPSLPSLVPAITAPRRLLFRLRSRSSLFSHSPPPPSRPPAHPALRPIPNLHAHPARHLPVALARGPSPRPVTSSLAETRDTSALLIPIKAGILLRGLIQEPAEIRTLFPRTSSSLDAVPPFTIVDVAVGIRIDACPAHTHAQQPPLPRQPRLSPRPTSRPPRLSHCPFPTRFTPTACSFSR